VFILLENKENEPDQMNTFYYKHKKERKKEKINKCLMLYLFSLGHF